MAIRIPLREVDSAFTGTPYFHLDKGGGGGTGEYRHLGLWSVVTSLRLRIRLE